MSNELAVIQPQSAVNFGSRLMKLKPGTININQPTTQAEGAIKGQLRISETGENYETMRVALLIEPLEKRQYYIGEQGSNRKPENLMCFSSNVVRDAANRELQGPDDKAKAPQALKCASCPRSSWDEWRENKIKENIPPCDAFYHVLFIDTQYQLPLQMYIRSKSKQSFEKGMGEITRLLYKMQVQGLNPQYYDVSFTIKAKKDPSNTKTTTYLLDMSDFKIVSPEEREQFGEAFQRYAATRGQAAELPAEVEASEQIAQTNAAINNTVVEPEYVSDAGEITI